MTDRSTRLTAVLAAIVAVLAVVAVFVTSYRGGGEEQSADSRTSDSGSVGGEPAPAGPEGGEPTEQPPDEGGDPVHPEAPDPEVIAEIQETTTRFLEAWSQPGNPNDRSEAIGPYATQALTQQLSDVDPANLPTGDLQGDPKVEGGTQSTATADAGFEGGPRVRCELVLGPDGWMVSRLLPLDQEQSDQAEQGDQNEQNQDEQGGPDDSRDNGGS